MDEPVAVWENQQAYIWTSSVTNSVSCGGGKPGQGYIAIMQQITEPVAFNWQSGGDCRLNPSTTGTDSLTVGQLPAVFLPRDDEPFHVVRKLTVLECERLMGWPDNYTLNGITDEGEHITLAKTNRYRICGNGIVSSVTEWIGARITTVT